jgi:hypothetical protein
MIVAPVRNPADKSDVIESSLARRAGPTLDRASWPQSAVMATIACRCGAIGRQIYGVRNADRSRVCFRAGFVADSVRRIVAGKSSASRIKLN